MKILLYFEIYFLIICFVIVTVTELLFFIIKMIFILQLKKK